MYSLHFDYGYSARQIAQFLGTNRNTINGDLAFWQSRVMEGNTVYDPYKGVLNSVERLELERTRLREQLDRERSPKVKIAIEKQIADIDYKIANIHLRLGNSTVNVFGRAMQIANDLMKQNDIDTRFMTTWTFFTVSKKAQGDIWQIVEQDKARQAKEE